MTHLSDPDRLERLARYILDEPQNTTPAEVADALVDAARRIRSSQERERRAHEEAVDAKRPPPPPPPPPPGRPDTGGSEL